MSKVVETTLFEVSIPVLTWDQYFNALIRERSYHTVEEYTVQTSYEVTASADVSKAETDSMYERSYVVVEDLENPSKVIREQLMKQLIYHKVEFKDFKMSFEESVEEATFKALENFTEIEKCVLVYMNEHHGYKHYMLAPTTRDEIILKLVNFTQGAVVVYKPQMFTLFKVKA